MPPLQPGAIRKLKRAGGVPGRLALKALRCASALPPLDPAVFADRLYRYHTLPRSSLGETRADFSRLAVRGDWRLRAPEDWPWVHLTRGEERDARWKIYLSPRPTDVYECVRCALPVLTAHGAVSVKVGRDTAAMLRPDRCLAYFDRRESLARASNDLLGALADFQGLGVPFTSPVGDGRLISWGVEPVPTPGQTPVSWRQWITAELGAALFAHATSAEDSGDPVAFALHRLKDRGVDPVRFMMRHESAHMPRVDVAELS